MRSPFVLFMERSAAVTAIIATALLVDGFIAGWLSFWVAATTIPGAVVFTLWLIGLSSRKPQRRSRPSTPPAGQAPVPAKPRRSGNIAVAHVQPPRAA